MNNNNKRSTAKFFFNLIADICSAIAKRIDEYPNSKDKEE